MPVDGESTHLLKSVGERVKSARKNLKFSRKKLSENSGVSQRYLAQLEHGDGNISLRLLFKVTRALNLKIEQVVAPLNEKGSEFTHALGLLNNATPTQCNKVIELLASMAKDGSKSNRIALIGLRGAGKSTLGKLASAALNIPFLELNGKIEEASGISIPEVFSLYGDEGFRRLERQSLDQTTGTHDTVILAVGGGIVSNPETFNALLNNYHTIWLQADPDDHMARVRAQGDERPMAGNPDAMNDLQQILSRRKSDYQRADAAVNTAHSTPSESLIKLLSAIEKNNFLKKETSE